MLTETDILGIRVQSGSARSVIAYIDERLKCRLTTRVAFLNANLSNICARRADVRKSLNGFLILNDGIGVDIACRLLHGKPFEENLNGTDFVSNYLDNTAHRLRIYLLGARPEVILRTAQKVAHRWPQHQVVGMHHGYIQKADELSLLSNITTAKPDLILVGMGNARQENWIAENVPSVCSCGMAVGAWFDFTADVVSRAPAWVRNARLEWVYRLFLEPRRLAGRYLVGNAVFLARLGLAKLRVLTSRFP